MTWWQDANRQTCHSCQKSQGVRLVSIDLEKADVVSDEAITPVRYGEGEPHDPQSHISEQSDDPEEKADHSENYGYAIFFGDFH